MRGGGYIVLTRRLLSWILIGVVVSAAPHLVPGEAAAAPTRVMEHPGAVPATYPGLLDSAGYVVPTAQPLATIFHAVEERQSLSTGDHIVIDAGANRHVQLGDWFTIIRQSPAIHHPVTTQPAGSMVATLGYATAVQVQASAAVLRLTKTFDAVELGDQVTRFEPPQPQVSEAAAPPVARSVSGYITAAKDGKVSLGEGDIVYLDRGQAEGVQIGDRFNIFREGDRVQHPITRRSIRLPRQVFGHLRVLDTRQHTATAVVTSSQREVSAGAPVALQDRPLLEAATRSEATVHDQDDNQTDAQLAQLATCLEVARQAIRAAAAAGAPAPELALAKSALASAIQQFEQAKVALARHDLAQARIHLQAAHADCLTAQQLSRYTATVAQPPPATDHYTVQRGDTLWGISGQPGIYQNPFMWPMIYQSNRDQIRDPDLIFPQQIFAIPRTYSREEADTAIQRARKRGPWRLGDGPDLYILEGIRP